MKITAQYRGLNYEIEITENNSNYSVWEETPIFKYKANILCGSSCDSQKFTKEYVEKQIDEALQELYNV